MIEQDNNIQLEPAPERADSMKRQDVAGQESVRFCLSVTKPSDTAHGGKKITWTSWRQDVNIPEDDDSPDNIFSMPEYDIPIDEKLVMQIKKGQVTCSLSITRKTDKGVFFHLMRVN